MTCSWLEHDLLIICSSFMVSTCSWLVHDMFDSFMNSLWLGLAHDLVVTTCVWLIQDLFMTCSWLVHYLLLPFSWLNSRNFFTISSSPAHGSFLTWSWLTYSCSLLVQTLDNGTGSTIAKHSSKLQEKIQKETDNMVEWLKDNRLCVAGEKSKLLVEGTKELRT